MSLNFWRGYVQGTTFVYVIFVLMLWQMQESPPRWFVVVITAFAALSVALWLVAEWLWRRDKRDAARSAVKENGP